MGSILDNSATLPLWDKLELPTWATIFIVYTAWGVLMYLGNDLPWWIFCPLGAVLIAWHGSIQHELLHGHPTRNILLNSALGWMPLGLWMPFHVYRESHLMHHQVDTLTQPVEDPESFYFLPADWASLCPVRRGILRINNTLFGRVIIGPMITLIRFAISELRLMADGNFNRLPGWMLHLFLVIAMLYGLEQYLNIPAWYYAIGCAYPGVSFILVRSFLEHRPAVDPAHRTAVVEGGVFWSLLFLNVNFHVPHHEQPGLPWYKLSSLYRADKDAIIERNGGYVFRSYTDVARQYLFRPKDFPVYPTG